MRNNKLTNILLLLSFIVLIFGSGYKVGEYKSRFAVSLQPTTYNRQQSNINFDLFWETWEKVEQKYSPLTILLLSRTFFYSFINFKLLH